MLTSSGLMRLLPGGATILAAGIAICWMSHRIDEPPKPSQQEVFRDVQAGHLARLDSVAIGPRVVFLGSSTFQGMDIAAITPVGLNLSIGGDTVPGLRERAAKYRALGQSIAVVLNIGFNDVVSSCQSIDATTWQELLQMVPAGRPLIVVGLQGTAPAKAETICDGAIADLVASSNLALQSACSSIADCAYVPNPVPPAPTIGHMGLSAPDGIHLSHAGYRLLVNDIRQRLEAALAARPTPPAGSP